jgi:hypothetical protein
MSVNCYECVNHVSFPCTIRYLNFGTKFPEGWVYVTTLVEYMFRELLSKIYLVINFSNILLIKQRLV